MRFIDGSDPFLSWWVALATILVVTGAVYLLLRVIIGLARDIDETLAQIWARGQRIASNTIQIANLYRTRDLVGGILGRAERIATHAKAIEEHARSCSGCPQCLSQPR
jgi:hypothetical protein